MNILRHIVITGASSGLGAALVMHYARPGLFLTLHGRDSARLEHVAGQAQAKGAIVQTVTGSVTDAEAMAAWLKNAHIWQPIDLLIVNAGISPGLKSGEETTNDVYAVMETNVLGVIHTVQPVVPLMKSRGGGQIAIMASLASFRGFNGAASYCASKAAVRVYGEALRADLAAGKIKVNVICPGFIATPMTEHNPFPMPFLMHAEAAAGVIARGLAKDRPRIAFPWPMYALVRLAAILPQDLINRVAARMRRKVA